MSLEFQDILYEKNNGRATLTINRPDKLNAFTNTTLVEMIEALHDSWSDPDVGVLVITGAGDRSFCVGGDQSIRSKEGYDEGEEAQGGFAGRARLPLPDNHAMMLWLVRNIPKPVIAKVNGYAIGGGHVLHLVCDLTIAAEKAKFGQAGPKVGSFDAGYGTAYLARVVGEKKAREIWYMCLQYTAQEALAMGLVNKVVPDDQLEQEVQAWCDSLLAKSPTSLQALKASFNADSDHQWGIHSMAGVALNLYYGTDEAVEGRNAFMEKRPPDFRKFITKK
ncbi:MAG: 1,4-dihydroxy-2-naphthoyl-CoA synthase [Bacillota bacterium]